MEDKERTPLNRCKCVAKDEVCAVYFLHGLADHMERWDSLKNFLIDRKVSFYGHDQRGHGRTELGVKAYIEDFNIFVDDTVKEIECLKRDKPDVPLIIMGHSMGGLIAVMVSLKRPDLIHGAILSAPYLKLSDNVSPFLKRLAWGIARVFPRFYMPWNSIDREKLTPNLEQREKDENDPLLWHYGVRAGFAVEMFKALDETEKNLSAYSIPTFIFHGEFDDVCDYSGSLKLAELKPDLVKLVRYEYPYHSLFHLMPEDTEIVMNDVHEKILELLGNCKRE